MKFAVPRPALRFLSLLALGLTLLLPIPSAQAQTVIAPNEARRAALFQVLLRQPSNLDASFEYAMLSAAAGDFEAAISTLERMLIFSPGLARVQLELAVLYFRVGAYDRSLHYLELVRAQEIPPQVRVRVDAFAQRAEQQIRPYRFRGTLSVGVQAHSNANAAPGQSVIDINGVPVTLSAAAQAASDRSAFALARLHYSYDLPGQGDLLEADLTLFLGNYAEQDRLDIGMFEVKAGPSFDLGRFGLNRARAGIYFIGGAVQLDGSSYAQTLGAGLRYRNQIDERLYLDASLEYRDTDYDNSLTYPSAGLQSGEDIRAKVQLTRIISARMAASVTLNARQVSAETENRSYDEQSVVARLNYRFDGPSAGILADNRPWSLTAAIGATRRGFDAPDPLIDPVNSRSDTAVWVEIGVEAPLENGFSGFASARYIRQHSNYATRDYDGAVLTLGLTKRF